MTRCRHSWRGLDTITAITRDVGDPFQYMHNLKKLDESRVVNKNSNKHELLN